MKSLGAVSSPQTGKYQAMSLAVKDKEVISFILRVAMKLMGSSYYTFLELTGFPFLFPFEYKVTKEQLMQDERFVLSTFDATLSVALKQ